jgi:hypothetical protein
LEEVSTDRTRQVLRIAKNEVERLNHGWYVVRNREIRDCVTIGERRIRERERVLRYNSALD